MQWRFYVNGNFLLCSFGLEHQTIADKEFVTKHAIANDEVFELEATGKEEVFFELIPVPRSLYLEFLKKNNIEV